MSGGAGVGTLEGRWVVQVLMLHKITPSHGGGLVKAKARLGFREPNFKKTML